MNVKLLRTSVILSILLLGLVRTECVWEKIGGLILPIGALLIGGLFVVVFVKFVAAVVSAIKHRSGLHLVPPGILLIAMFDVAYNPLGFDCEAFKSPVVIRACYEGTVNMSTLKLRANQRFEIQSIGFMGFSDFEVGNWRIIDDTLSLEFTGRKPGRLPSQYIMDGDGFISEADHDSTRRRFAFYRGYCTGLN